MYYYLLYIYYLLLEPTVPVKPPNIGTQVPIKSPNIGTQVPIKPPR